jgi:hypothetical protein
MASNKARPFWGWFDTRSKKAKAVATGQWALDPAYSVSRNLSFPMGDPFSLDYTFHPYFEIATEGGKLAMAAPRGFTKREFNAAVSTGSAGAGNAVAGGPGGWKAVAGTALGGLLKGSGEGPSPLAGILEKAGAGSGATDQLKGMAESLGGAPAAAQAAGATPAPAAASTTAAPAAAAATAAQNECRISVLVSGPGELVLQGSSAEYDIGLGMYSADKPAMKCSAVLPQSAFTPVVEKAPGSGDVQLASAPSKDNDFSARIAIKPPAGAQPEVYEIIVRW